MPWTNDQLYAMVNKPEPADISRYDLINKPQFDELIHYGVKGMKWGIRRYQNPDGTLTAAGKAREKKKEAREIKKHDKVFKNAIKNPDKIEKYYDRLTPDEISMVKKKYSDISEIRNRQNQSENTKRNAYATELKIRENKRKTGILGTAAFTAASLGTVMTFMSSANGEKAMNFVKNNAKILNQRIDPSFIGPKQLLPGEQFVKNLIGWVNN